ncbi:MAG: DUF6883 domain-containing protein [Phycisphaerae bacterium]|nr:hypothetical protein [Phycisphaerae bacterium]
MKMPGLVHAVVPKDKITSYLLSETHPTGRAKAIFFCGYGFAPGAWEELVEALVRHAASHEVAATEESRFGVKYTIEGPLETPDGRNPRVRVVWFVRKGEGAPRLVTAYPCKEGA